MPVKFTINNKEVDMEAGPIPNLPDDKIIQTGNAYLRYWNGGPERNQPVACVTRQTVITNG